MLQAETNRLKSNIVSDIKVFQFKQYKSLTIFKNKT